MAKIFFVSSGHYPAPTGNGVSGGTYLWIQVLKGLGYHVVIVPAYMSAVSPDEMAHQRGALAGAGFSVADEIGDVAGRRFPRWNLFRQALAPTRDNQLPGLAVGQERLRAFAGAENPDVVIAYDWPSVALVAPLARQWPCIAVVVDLWDDNLAVRWRGLGQLSFGRRWRECLSLLGNRRNQTWGIRDLRQMRVVVEHAAHHAAHLRSLGLPAVYHIPHCMPGPTGPGDIGVAPPDDASEVRILMLGSLKGATSRLGFEFLLGQILPRLRSRRAECRRPYRIRIVGYGNMQPSLRSRLEQAPEIEWGFAKDSVAVAAEYRSCHMVLVAIPVEVGFRTRVAEAFGYGKCVVAHSANAAGMPEMQDGLNALCAADADDLVSRIIAAANDCELRLRLAAAARSTFERSYSTAAMQQALPSVIVASGISLPHASPH